MATPVKVGDVFRCPKGGRVFTRLPDDPSPRFQCERILLLCHAEPEEALPAQLFGTEPEWFRQRGLEVDDQEGPDA
jgi:hypothetical protein